MNRQAHLTLLLLAADEVLNGESPAVHASGAGSAVAGNPKVNSQRVRTALLTEASRGNAGTGTAIAGLHGVTRENAIMAQLGGGPLYQGGDGMAGGAKLLNRASRTEVLRTYGVNIGVELGAEAAAILAQIGVRYAMLVRKYRALERKARAESEVEG